MSLPVLNNRGSIVVVVLARAGPAGHRSGHCGHGLGDRGGRPAPRQWPWGENGVAGFVR